LSAMAIVLSGPRFLSGCPMFGKNFQSELSLLLSLLFLFRNLSLVFSSAMITFLLCIFILHYSLGFLCKNLEIAIWPLFRGKRLQSLLVR
jgi:hypothetical protein